MQVCLPTGVLHVCVCVAGGRCYVGMQCRLMCSTVKKVLAQKPNIVCLKRNVCCNLLTSQVQQLVFCYNDGIGSAP